MKNFFQRYHWTILATLLAVAVVGGAFWHSTQPAYGVIGFGGPILDVFYCTCPPFGVLLTIGPPGPVGTYLFQPGISLLYLFGQIYTPSKETLGTYTPGGRCFYVHSDGCNEQPVTQGTILMVGTSQ